MKNREKPSEEIVLWMFDFEAVIYEPQHVFIFYEVMPCRGFDTLIAFP